MRQKPRTPLHPALSASNYAPLFALPATIINAFLQNTVDSPLRLHALFAPVDIQGVREGFRDAGCNSTIAEMSAGEVEAAIAAVLAAPCKSGPDLRPLVLLSTCSSGLGHPKRCAGWFSKRNKQACHIC